MATISGTLRELTTYPVGANVAACRATERQRLAGLEGATDGDAAGLCAKRGG